MKLILMPFLAVILSSATALADKPVPPPEAEKIQAALQAWDCSGGKMEQETEASSVYGHVIDGIGRSMPHYIRSGADQRKAKRRFTVRSASLPAESDVQSATGTASPR